MHSTWLMIRTAAYKERVRAIAAGEEVTLRTARWKWLLLFGGSILFFCSGAGFLWIAGLKAGAIGLLILCALAAVFLLLECLRPTTVQFSGDRIEVRGSLGRRRGYRLHEIQAFRLWRMGSLGFCAFDKVPPNEGMGGLPLWLTVGPFDLVVALNRRLALWPSAERDQVVREALRAWTPTDDPAELRLKRDEPFVP